MLQMGFISSLLCCSSSNSTTPAKAKQKPTTVSTPKKSAAATPSQSRIHASLSNSTQKMTPATSSTNNKQPSKAVTPSKSLSKHSKQTKAPPRTKSNGAVTPTKTADSTSEYDENESDAMDIDEDDLKEDKQIVTVYNGETDTSTGTTDDHPTQQLPQGTEVTTIVQEDDNSSSAEESEVPHSNENSDIEMANGPLYGMDDEIIDIAALQPGQSHAPGLVTLLPPRDPVFEGKKCLVLDLDETLVHSSFKYLRTADFVIPVEIDDQVHNVYVIKRPGVDEFLDRVGKLYEVVVFTASVSRYGDPLLDILDPRGAVHHRLFRDSCYNYDGNYIKNLSQIGRPLSDLIILDNSPASYILHPQHAIPISSWFSDAHDNELLDIMPLLEDLSKQKVPDVGKILDVTI